MSIYKQLQKKIGEHPLMGAMVYWSFAHVNIEATELDRAFQTFGIDYKLRDVGESRALTKALKGLRKAEHQKRIRKIVSDEDRTVYGVSDEDIDVDALEVDYNRDTVVIYEKATKTLRFKYGSDTNTEIESLFNSLIGSYDAEDMSRLAKRIIRQAGGVTLRKRGGVYFVAATQLKLIEKFSKLVNDCLPDSHFSMLGIVDTERTRTTVARDFNREINSEIKSAGEELEALLNSTDEVRVSTLETRLERYNKLREKSKMYAEVLRHDSKNILRKVSRLEKRITDLLDQV